MKSNLYHPREYIIIFIIINYQNEQQLNYKHQKFPIDLVIRVK